MENMSLLGFLGNRRSGKSRDNYDVDIMFCPFFNVGTQCVQVYSTSCISEGLETVVF